MKLEKNKAKRFDRPSRLIFDRYRSGISAPRSSKKKKERKAIRSRTRNRMERDAHNCARVMGPLGCLKRRPLPNDTNYVINVPRVRSPPVDDFSVTAQSSRPHVTTPACVTTLKWSASYNTASRLSLGSAARAISGSGLGGMEKKYVIVRIYSCTRQRTQTTTRNTPPVRTRHRINPDMLKYFRSVASRQCHPLSICPFELNIFTNLNFRLWK